MKTHLYAQPCNHGDAYLVADVEGLTAIRDACDAALKRGHTAVETSTEDGESYALIVMHLETRDPKWAQLHLPFPLEGVDHPVGVHPIEILGTLPYRELHSKLRSDRPEKP